MAFPGLERRFFTAPFAADGELMGIGATRLAQLSPHWMAICLDVIRENGPTFRVSFGQTLAHIEVKLTSASGIGLGTLYVHGNIVVSTAYLRGEDTAAERQAVQMFVDSLRNVDLVRQAKVTEKPFEAMTTITERPLHVVVVWGNSDVSAQDNELVRELSNHFAAAFLHPSED